MAQINTTEDLIRLLRGDEEFRAAAQRELLTEALLNLPAQFAAFSKETTETLDALKTDTESLHSILTRHQSDYADFRGSQAETETRRRDRLIAATIARARGSRVSITERVSYDSLGQIFGNAVERNLLDDIEEDSEDSFQNSDLALLVHERNRENSQFYIMAQASYTGHLRDFTRARDHARIIGRVRGIDAYAVVSGVRIGRSMPNDLLFDANALVTGGGVLWYQLRDTDPDE